MLSALKARVPRFKFEFRRSTTDSSSSEDEEDENKEEDEEKRGKKDDDFDFDDDDSMTPPRKQPEMSSSLRKNGTRGGDRNTKSRLGKKNRVVSFDDGTFSDEEVEEEGGDDEEMLLFGTISGSSEKSIEIDLTKCAEKMRLVLERCTRMGISLVECARAVGSNGRYSNRKRMSSKNRNGGASSTYGRGGRGGDKASDMKSYYVESRKKMQKRTRRLVVPRVVISVVLFWMIMYLWYRKRTMMDGLGDFEKRIGESESMKNARLEVDAAKEGDYDSREKFHSSRETTFSGGIFPSHERVGSAEYERETERLMEALAKRIATGQHHSADFNDARRHVREHRMRNNLVHVDNAEVMRLREAKRQLRDDFLQMGPKCEFDTSGMSRESIKDMKEECKEFFREEEKRIGKIPLLDDAKYKVHADNQLDREHFRGHRQKLPTIVDIRAMDMVPH